ncbi:MAG: DivIVA domain-containing protein [Erysipelotrichaceae bacterium]|jgi:DivIVA domain-containing protein|nr:DivIVA domain-containing protein [Erysipelotrichaceae bacterium]
MDEDKINLTSADILQKIFTPNVKGYDPDEVDDYLDVIINDYRSYEKFAQETKRYIESLETQLREAKERYNALEIEYTKANNRLSGIKQGSGNVTPENINLLNRISALEAALCKLGGDPRKV